MLLIQFSNSSCFYVLLPCSGVARTQIEKLTVKSAWTAYTGSYRYSKHAEVIGAIPSLSDARICNALLLISITSFVSFSRSGETTSVRFGFRESKLLTNSNFHSDAFVGVSRSKNGVLFPVNQYAAIFQR